MKFGSTHENMIILPVSSSY